MPKHIDWEAKPLPLAARSLILQPHYDDFVFNGWGLLVAGAIPLPVIVATVFSRSSHVVDAIRQPSIAAVSRMRCREDARLWSQFSDVVPIGLGFPDLPDRSLSESVWRLVSRVEIAIAELIGRFAPAFLVVQRPSRSRVHPDHRIVLAAAMRAAARAKHVRILFTNDAPYSMTDPLDRELIGKGYRVALFPLSVDDLSSKLRSIEIYESQVRPSFEEFALSNPWEALWLPGDALVPLRVGATAISPHGSETLEAQDASRSG